MQLRVRFFAALREIIGAEEIRLDWNKGMTNHDVMNLLKRRFHEIAPLLDHSLVAVNGEYMEPSHVLMPEDEVAILPPASGG